jgi:hypothetical protein
MTNNSRKTAPSLIIFGQIKKSEILFILAICWNSKTAFYGTLPALWAEHGTCTRTVPGSNIQAKT